MNRKQRSLETGLLLAALVFWNPPLGTQQNAPAPLQNGKYAGDVRENDPRVFEIRKGLLGGTTAPAALRLRYSGRRGNYAAFYDLDGVQLYYRFRNDRFDLRSLRKLGFLVPGQAYLVRGGFLGVWFEGKLIVTSEAVFGGFLKDENSTLTFEFQGASPLRVEQILF